MPGLGVVLRNALPASVALLVVWSALAWYRPATTWHLAPRLAVAAGPVLLRVRQGRARWSFAAGAAGATAAAALVTTAALARADLLKGRPSWAVRPLPRRSS